MWDSYTEYPFLREWKKKINERTDVTRDSRIVSKGQNLKYVYKFIILINSNKYARLQCVELINIEFSIIDFIIVNYCEIYILNGNSYLDELD